ncbi:MAG: bifunctional serine/threonine-protein kinase/formylglycine-generating enzyme family protein [Planctomycetota bacterium]|nr:bifunctional serine/threonine-protein kinase/formylglycine-generating enzyme family protein [Planctomycetota bacterium]
MMDKHLDILFGILALNVGFINKNQLTECVHEWLKDPRPHGLPDLLRGRGFVNDSQADAVDTLVRAHLGSHSNSPSKALRATEIDPGLRDELLREIVVAGTQNHAPTELASVKHSLAESRRQSESQTVFVSRAPKDKYYLQQKLGEGGLGTVLMALDTDIGRPVAIKFIRHDAPPGFTERFHRESVITGRLEHPNIIPVHDIGMMEHPDGVETKSRKRSSTKRMEQPEPVSHERFYMAMKLVKGRDLGELIQSSIGGDKADAEKWTLRRFVEVFHDVCNAIAYAHSQGVIHRDLKPSNIMVGEFGEVLVVDWGLAKVRGETDIHVVPLSRGVNAAEPGAASKSRLSDLSKSGTKTLDGAVFGTPQYMPPEQARGLVSEIDEQSDVYSLGAILYEILTTCPPFDGPDSKEILVKVIAEDMVPPAKRLEEEREWYRNLGRKLETKSGVKDDGAGWLEPVTSCPEALIKREIPPELDQICMRCLARKKKDRYRSVLALADEIRLYLEGAKERERRHALAETAVAEGRLLVRAYHGLKKKWNQAREKAETESTKLKGFMPLREKRKIWSIEDQAKAAQHTVIRCLNEAIGKFMEAAGHEPESKDAKKGLCELYWDRYIAAEERSDEMDTAYYRGLLMTYGREWYESRFQGPGTLGLRTITYDCDCLHALSSRPPAAGNAKTRTRSRSGATRQHAAAAAETARRWGPVFHQDDMVPFDWCSKVFAKEFESHIPRIDFTGHPRYGHRDSCHAHELEGVDVWIFEYKEIDRLFMPSHPSELVASLNGIKKTKSELGLRAGHSGTTTRKKLSEVILAPSTASGHYLGRTPLKRFSLPPGSFLLLLQKPGYVPVRCPVFVSRERDIEQTVTMYRPEECPEQFVPVPGGSFFFGGAGKANMERVVVDIGDFMIARLPVTCAEYLEFLNDLARSDLESARKHAPREGEASAYNWVPDAHGVFHIPARGERQLVGGGTKLDWQPDWPVTGISWIDALAYCAWRSAKDGRFYLLPTEEQWEKAARGADGRLWPFGNHGDPSFCNVNDTFEDGNKLLHVGAITTDESPYGVRDLAGNVREWCLNDPGKNWRHWRSLRGGTWNGRLHHARANERFGYTPERVDSFYGLRLVLPCADIVRGR